MDKSEASEFRSTFQHLLDGPPDQVVPNLSDMGWGDLYESDPATAVGLLFEQVGVQLCTAPLLDMVIAAALGVPADYFRCLLPFASSTVDGTVDGLVASMGAECSVLLPVAIEGASAPGMVVASADELADGMRAVQVSGLDESLQLTRLTGATSSSWSYPNELPALQWDQIVGLSQRAIAHELLGTARAMLDIAVNHVSTRRQFGRELGSFQAVKHRLADVHVAIAGAEGVLDESWTEEDTFASAVAKGAAAEAVALARLHSQQVCGAIGFTWEFPLHRYVRRSLVLESFFGPTEHLVERVGTDLIASAQAPRIGGVYPVA